MSQPPQSCEEQNDIRECPRERTEQKNQINPQYQLRPEINNKQQTPAEVPNYLCKLPFNLNNIDVQ